MEKSIQKVHNIRRFNRFYTNKIGVLGNQLLNTSYTISEARILFELAQRKDLNASKLVNILKMDPGYISRILKSFSGRGLISRARSRSDGRQQIVNLTSKGLKEFSILNSRADDQIIKMLKTISKHDQERLVKAVAVIETILDDKTVDKSPILIRTHRSGDLGWIIERHGVLYNEEYHFDETFEALVAEILGKLIKKYDHRRDHIWIAEFDGERAGMIVAANINRTTVQLRLFLVEPWVRGRCVGKLLIKECIRFAKQAGYKKIKLWTQSILIAARHLYEMEGFKLVSQENHRSFGHDLVAETWLLKL